MLDHVGIAVADTGRSKVFYDAALAPISGYFRLGGEERKWSACLVKVDEYDRVTSIERAENMIFLRSKLESRAEPLSRETEFVLVDADDRHGCVVVVRKMKMTDRLEKSVFSIRPVWEDSRWQVIHETAFVQPLG